jgi:hypothetical protein
VVIRVAVGRDRVVREVRATAPLMSELAAPVTARGPWLTAVLNVQSAPLLASARPRAVVVEQSGRPAGTRRELASGGGQGGPSADGAALLSFRRRGPVTAVTLLGDAVGPVPGGSPPRRLYARDDDAAGRLADGVVDLLAATRGPWTLRLAGLPLGDPTVRRLAGVLDTAAVANDRSRRLTDDLDSVADVRRSRDPGEIERRLPALLGRLPAGERRFARAAARLHASIGRVELAVVPGPDGPAAALLTLLDGPDADVRLPWWGFSDVGGLGRVLGSPVVTLTAAAGLRGLSRRA